MNIEKVRKRWKGVLALCLCFSLMLPGVSAQAKKTKGEAGKYINIVYDDSGSMIKSNGHADGGTFLDKWCQAKYAMEVFATMIQEKDTLNIFPMSEKGKVKLSLKGSDSAKKRGESVHNMDTRAGGTPYKVVQSAYENVKKKGGDKDKWLVVLTDGEFDEGVSSEQLKKNFAAYSKSGVKVVYLAIGDEVTYVETDPANHIYCYYAKTSEEILENVTQIGNLISERLQLGGNHVNVAGNTLVLDVDVPMERVIIFAQGKDVSIGDLKNDDSKIQKESDIGVKYCSKVNSNYRDYGDKIKYAKNLSGEIATFVSKDPDRPMSAGKYKVDITDTSNVQVYYNAAVKAVVEMTQDGKTVDPDSFLEPGKVDLQTVLKNPITNEVIKSDLMSDVRTTYTITNGDKSETLDAGSGKVTVDVKQGKLKVLGEVELPGNYMLNSELEIDVLEPLPPLELSEIKLKGKNGDYTKDELSKGPAYETVTVKQEGKPLSKEMWEKTDLKITSASDCVFLDAERGKEVSTWKIKVSYDKSKDKNQLKDENVNYSVSAFLELDGRAAKNEPLQDTFTVRRMSLLEFLKNHIKEAIGIAILLWALLGLTFGKKRLPKSLAKYPRVKISPLTGFKKLPDDTGFFKKNFFSKVFPWVKETGEVWFTPGGGGASLSIKAKSNRSSFVITNASSFVGNEDIRFNGKVMTEQMVNNTYTAALKIDVRDVSNKFTCILNVKG